MNRIYIGLTGLVVFVAGAFMTGFGINTLTALEGMGIYVMIVGSYISGYCLAMRN